MQNKKLIILIILGVAAIFSLAYGVISSPKIRKNLPVRQETIYQLEKAQLEKTAIPVKRRAKRTKFTSWNRSLFSTQGISSEASGLTGILWDEYSPKAIIDGAIVGIGDKTGDNSVADIQKDRVILNDGAKDFELLLGR